MKNSSESDGNPYGLCGGERKAACGGPYGVKLKVFDSDLSRQSESSHPETLQ